MTEDIGRKEGGREAAEGRKWRKKGRTEVTERSGDEGSDILSYT
jgi:hypothetical protein